MGLFTLSISSGVDFGSFQGSDPFHPGIKFVGRVAHDNSLSIQRA